jgi:carbonic anhydrase
MSEIERLLANNERYARSFGAGDLAAPPRLRLAILTCMDARIDIHRALGLAEGDAHVIRNAGGLVSDDAIRSLVISQRLLGTEEIAVIRHTACGMLGLDDGRLVEEIERDAGVRPTWAPGGFADLEEGLRAALSVLRGCSLIPRRQSIRGFVYEVHSGRLRELVD